MYTAPHQAQKSYVLSNIPPSREKTKPRSPRCCILLASTKLSPPDILEPWDYLTRHGFFVEFATWDGNMAIADEALLNHALWGVKASAHARWQDLTSLEEWKQPHAWATSDGASTTTWSLESYDLTFIPGGAAQRSQLQGDTALQALLTKQALFLDRQLGAKVIAVVGEGFAPLLTVSHPLTQQPLLQSLITTGPLYESWTGALSATKQDVSVMVPKLAKEFKNRQVVVDPLHWFISSPSHAWHAESLPVCVSLTRAAIEVDELRKLEQQGTDKAKRLTTAQRDRQATALKFDGLTTRQKERLNSEGIGKRETGFVLSQWSWGWRKDIE
ncbi:hypothetical protein BCR37DRAFT_164003 [Protomyces lactucae-debilis]|uniref:DJ-1/PfpI domain-containing protein n=1 Tax=Protomyces lactucae-debilis TaxID=2754530 RepID=A0A1Y2EXJ4_PROLT|nr:uncharacterized protein BCR37DRAFT_164003 [Protomyces lactucae-debilis]ORY76331.1 hypothetical protein BCR37DRAFT_164003 [Protomyces lactucae-debilis]